MPVETPFGRPEFSGYDYEGVIEELEVLSLSPAIAVGFTTSSSPPAKPVADGARSLDYE